MKTTQRCYSFLSLNGKETLDQTIAIYTKGSSLWLNFWLDLLGGMEEKFLNDSPISTFSTAKKSKKGDGETIHDLAILFSCWFSLENKDGAPEKFITKPEDVMDIFHVYSGIPKSSDTCKHHTSQWLRVLQATVNSYDKEKSVWVDRRRSFRHSILAYADLQQVFCNPGFWLQEQKDVKGHTYMRDLLCSWWGDGKKSDWKTIHATYVAMKKVLDKDLNTTRRRILDLLKLPNNAKAEDINNRFGDKQGRPDAIATFLEKPKADATTEDLQELIDEKLHAVEYRLSFKKQPWHDKLLSHVEKTLGIKYLTEKSSHRDQICEMASQAIQKLKSWKKNSFNQMVERLTHLNQPDYPYPEIAEWMQEYKDRSGQQNVNSISGLDKVFALWTDDFPSAVTQAQRQWMKLRRRFGDVNMFLFLGEKIGNRKEDWLEQIRLYVDWDYHQYVFKTMKTPRLCHFNNEHPASPCFGNSRPSYKLGKHPELVGNYKVYKLHLNAFDGNKFQTQTFDLVSKRYSDEIYVANGSGRHHKLMDAAVKSYDMKGASVKDAGLRLILKDDKYYVNLSVTMPKINTKAELATGTKIMGVDLGVRHSAAYSIFEVCEPRSGEWSIIDDQTYVKIRDWKSKDKILTKVKGKNVWLKLISHGFIRDSLKMGYDGRRFCRLTGDTNLNVNDDELNMWNLMVVNGIVKEEDVSGLKRSELSRLAASAICYYYRGKLNEIRKEAKANSTKETYKDVLSDMRKRSPVTKDWLLHAAKLVISDKNRIGRGGLSHARIKTLQSLNRACSRFLQIKEDVEVQELQEWLHNKITAVRKERIRVTVNKILGIAIENKVKVIFAEDLTIRSASNTAKFLNRMIDVWCPKWVCKDLKTQADLYPLAVWSVEPSYTSNRDWLSGEEKCRMVKVQMDELATDFWQSVLQDLYTDKGNSWVNGLLRAGWNKLFAEWGLTSWEQVAKFVAGKKTRILVPQRYGDRYLTVGGEMNSDIVASCNIAMKGAAYVLSYD